ncbi:MAG: hypothetical protein LBU32_11535 [Clostridiales bacterium]|jgi:hypothetical protein|nr:hypothetical protein [Clostridiales bacterium]
MERIWTAGHAAKSKLGAISAHACKSNFDAEEAMDAVKAVYDAEPDIAAIASGGYIRLDGRHAGCHTPKPGVERIEPSASAGALDALRAAEGIAEAGAGDNSGEAECRSSPASGMMERALGEPLVNPPGVE